ncbi:MAG: hypothetical protein ACRDIB_11935 [Ardenticatenaceae bacterium]
MDSQDVEGRAESLGVSEGEGLDLSEEEPAISLGVEKEELLDEKKKRYDKAFIEMFKRVYKPNATEVPYTLRQLREAAREVGIEIKNIPDVNYGYRVGRYDIPNEISEPGKWWIIEGVKKGEYKLVQLRRSPWFTVPRDLYITEIPEATPDIVLKYGGSDEQGMLTRVRYNRLVDTFLSLTAYHLQGHARSAVPGMGQVEVDDLYVGVNTAGEWHVIPVEAKSKGDRVRLGVVQVRQMILYARHNYSSLTLRPVGFKILADGSLVFMEFDDEINYDQMSVKRYARYRLIRDDTPGIRKPDPQAGNRIA